MSQTRYRYNGSGNGNSGRSRSPRSYPHDNKRYRRDFEAENFDDNYNSKEYDRERYRSRKDSFHEHERSNRDHKGRDNIDAGKQESNMLHFMSLHDWKKQKRFQGSDLDAIQPYKGYIKKYAESLEEQFFVLHKDEEWFRNRYDFVNLIKQREERKELVKNSAMTLIEKTTSADVGLEGLSLLFPNLTAKKLMTEQQNNSIGESEKPAPVGLDVELDKIVFIPRLFPKISTPMLTEAMYAILGITLPVKRKKSEDETNAEEYIDNKEVSDASEQRFHFYFSDPCALNSNIDKELFIRTAWIFFEAAEDAAKVVKSETYNFTNGDETEKVKLFVKFYPQKIISNRIIDANVSAPARIRHDMQQASKLAIALDRMEDLTYGLEHLLATEKINQFISAVENQDKLKLAEQFLQGITDKDILTKLEDDRDKLADIVLELESNKRRLDIILMYLRKVHLICYYNGAQFRDRGDQLSEAFLPPLRAPLHANIMGQKLLLEFNSQSNRLVSTDDSLKFLDEKINSIYSLTDDEALKVRDARRNSDRDRFEKLREKLIDEFVNDNAVEEGENRFRCRLPPNKLFRGIKFLKKHILTKHEEEIEKLKMKARDEVMSEIYARDPAKPLPTEERLFQKGVPHPIEPQTLPISQQPVLPMTSAFPGEVPGPNGLQFSGPPTGIDGVRFPFPGGMRPPMHGGVQMHGLPQAPIPTVVEKKVVISLPEAKARTIVDYSDL